MVESRGKRIVVDTCVGNDKDRTLPPLHHLHTSFLDDLAARGLPARVDRHGGVHAPARRPRGLEHDEGRRALGADLPERALPGRRREWEHWSKQDDRSIGDVLGDSVRPIFEAGLVDLVEPGHALTDEVALEPTPGHTPGHVSVRIRSGGAEAVITGDLMHHPVQCAHPDWGSSADFAPPRGSDPPRVPRDVGRPAGARDRHPFRRAPRRADRSGGGAYRFELV